MYGISGFAKYVTTTRVFDSSDKGRMRHKLVVDAASQLINHDHMLPLTYAEGNERRTTKITSSEEH